MKVGDLVLCAGRPALVVGLQTGNVDFVYIITNKGHRIMINREHLKLVPLR
jgi:hypothetical protein